MRLLSFCENTLVFSPERLDSLFLAGSGTYTLRIFPSAPISGLFSGFACEAFNFALSLRRLTKVTGVSFPLLRQAALPLLASCGAVSLSHLFFHLSPALNSGTPLATATGIALSSSLYFLFLLLFGVIPHGLPLRLLKKLFAALPAREGKGSFGAGA